MDIGGRDSSPRHEVHGAVSDRFHAIFVQALPSLAGRLPEITNGRFVDVKQEEAGAERWAALEKPDGPLWVYFVEKLDSTLES